MNVVYATDDNYAKYSGISMISLLENNRDLDSLIIWFLDNGISPENKEHLRTIADAYERQLFFVSIRDYEERLDFVPDTHGFNPIVVVRLILSQYLPDTVDKVLYIDGDTLVTRSLRKLENLDMRDYLVAAVPELYMPPAKKKESIGFKKEDTYYNAGVLWINLKKWRESGSEKVFIEYYKENSAHLLYNDQDVINKCCEGHILSLPQWYNMSANFRYFPKFFVKRIQPRYEFSSARLYRKMVKKPVIIHYMGDERPWIHGNHNYYLKIFEYYKSLTPWKDCKQEYGKEAYMLFYHILNVTTLICPWGRIAFSNLIGINKYKWFGKK